MVHRIITSMASATISARPSLWAAKKTGVQAALRAS
jgi:hypothetical protein